LVTVFAGGPDRVDPLPGWDVTCGFRPGDDVVATRRLEDREAAEVLRASTRHLVHWDRQYRGPEHGYDGPGSGALVARIAADVAVVIDELDADAWLIPLGILHPDHRAAAEGCLDVAAVRRDIDWLVYEELPYATAFPEQRDEAVDHLRRKGFELVPEADEGTPRREDLKRRAVECYRTQLDALGPGAEEAILIPERIGRLMRTPPGPGL
jgi:LmbE family N-acetylglucosaminyl deacetylase